MWSRGGGRCVRRRQESREGRGEGGGRGEGEGKKTDHAHDAAEHDEVEDEGGEAVERGNDGGRHGDGLLDIGRVGEADAEVVGVEDLWEGRGRGEAVR